MQEPTIKVKNDMNISLALGQSKSSKRWKNKELSWSEFLQRLANPTITQETVAEYQKMSKTNRDTIKDVGGFVGGWLKQGRRKADAVQTRSILTLDADSVTDNIWESVELAFGYTAAMYSTHSHTTAKPRLRLIIPLSRVVTAEEYQPIARKVADMFGMDNFDDTTYQPERLMFWPSCSRDADFVFEHQEGAYLDPDEILNQYPDWADSTYWPESSRSHGIRERQAKKQGDPLEKKGTIGAFCKAYDIHSAIEKFLTDVYVPSDKDDRYTFLGGSTSGGLIIYDDKFAYSHHGTDPVGDTLVNAFDLVRIHKFADLDEDAKDNTPSNRLPSFKAMREFAMEDKAVKGIVIEERMESAFDDFEEWTEDGEEVNKDWLKELDLDETNSIAANAKNLEMIMRNDPNLKEKLALNQFSNEITVKKDLPWREITNEDNYWKDSDDAGLRIYIEKTYGISHMGKVNDAFTQEVERNAFHPVREYLDTLEWDGQERIATMFHDYLGAEDNDYNRFVATKILVAAVARVLVPGIKFDYMVVTSGPQGIGKSLLPAKLAGDWFSDSLTSVSGKEAYELLQGTWIMEMGEMTATKKAEVEATKQFISKQVDRYRVAYGKRAMNFKRQCIFWGTTNDSEYLRDRTGGRRFWPVDTAMVERKLTVWNDLTSEVRDQMWAEALELWRGGYSLAMNVNEEKLARDQQEAHREVNALEGMVSEYLDIKITEDWYQLSRNERRNFISAQSDDELVQEGTVERSKVSVMEVWCELLEGDPKNLLPVKAKEIREILSALPNWKRHQEGTGKLRMGKDYGAQRAYIRL